MDLGLERAGFDIAWQVENNDYCRQILAKHWPAVPCHGDITTIDWRDVPAVDLVCGGFPCQPFSVAGKQRGKDDNRYLWPEVVRCLDVLRPTWFLGENVPGIINLALDQVCTDLEGLGYQVWPVCVPACAVDAPHRRQRVWIVAHASCERRQQNASRTHGNEDQNERRAAAQTDQSDRDGEGDRAGVLDHTHTQREPQPQGAQPAQRGRTRHGSQDVADAESTREKPAQQQGQRYGVKQGGEDVAGPSRELLNGSLAARETGRRQSPNQSTGVSYTDGQQARRTPKSWKEHREWLPEPDVGRVAHGVPSRVHRLRGLGNAVVPQVVEALGRMILEVERS